MAHNLSEWFHRSEAALEIDAERVGLLEHGTTVGSAREFLVQRVLRSFLPPMVHIGTGIIVDSDGNRSRQIDIIIYDPRFPLFEVSAGVGMYLIEGVMATIEVKSTMNQETYLESLDNCHSVLRLKIVKDIFETEIDQNTRVSRACSCLGLESGEALRQIALNVTPSTYIFAFWTDIKCEGLRNQTLNWIRQNNHPRSLGGNILDLPRVIIAGTSFGVFDDGYFQIRDTDGSNQGKPIVMFGTTARRFGALACHLTRAVTARLGLIHGREGMKYSVAAYLDSVCQAISGELARSETKSIDWLDLQ